MKLDFNVNNRPIIKFEFIGCQGGEIKWLHQIFTARRSKILI